VGGGLAPGLVREEQPDDEANRRQKCGENVATKKRTVINDPLVQGLTDTDNEWFRARSLIDKVQHMNAVETAPIHITGAYQDEQTGPRGFTHLWEQIPAGVPKRLLITNGDHNTQNPAYTGAEVYNDRKAWIDQWMGVAAGGFGTSPTVKTLIEYHRDSTGALVSNGTINDTSFPLSTTTWTDWHLRAGNSLTQAAPTGAEASDNYVSGSPRQGWSYQAGENSGSEFTTPEGPDEVNYVSGALASDTTIVGPITANLFVSSTAPDTELFVQLIDEAPDGSRTYLQRGMLRAAHRGVDPGLSDYDSGGHLYRPWRPHSNADLITPGQAYEYLVEVFPVGHVFRSGHKIVVKVHTPPAVDSYYAYVPKRVPAINTILHDSAHPSRITLPVVPTPTLGSALACGAQEAVRCIP
jgi:putative CocE/NonD family hydrolase